ncbi:TrmO family methyltransferase [Desulfoscipio sp. XC116]|uniref:TrmO family methyltransferase domain-containing protein n=1 Tax=Desulfoscipio sp. XC116 TaxID=3144975 RepID=UPI00325A5B55
MEKMTVKPVGKIVNNQSETHIVLNRSYLPALEVLESFGYLQVFWWFSGCDNEASRTKLSVKSPYTHGPALLGTFATRSPERPNPLALSCAQVTYIDKENAVIGLAYIDADNDSPVLDIKPYIPSLDRVEAPIVPQWCSHWPKSCEKSGDFDWKSEFNF